MRRLPSDAWLSLTAFVILGLPIGALGVAWSRMRVELHAPLAGLGFILTIATVAAFSNVATGRYVQWWGQRRVVMIGALVGGAGALGLGMAPSWPAALIASVAWGLGTGPLDAAVNAHVARSRRVRLMGSIHAAWGFGAALGPLIALVAIRVGSWRWAYLGFGLAFVALAGAAAVTRWDGLQDGRPAATKPDERRLTAGMIALSVGLFAVNFGLETSAGQWAFTTLTLARGLPATLAGLFVSLYWGCLTAGRVLLGVFGAAARQDQVLFIGMSLVVVGALGLWLAPSLVAASCLPLIGLGMSIVIPLLYLASGALGSQTARLVGYQSGGGTVGGATIPTGIGLLMQSTGSLMLGPAVLALAVLQMALQAASRRHDTARGLAVRNAATPGRR